MNQEKTPESAHNSVTRWLAGLKAGETEAVRKLWERYSAALIAAARKQLGNSPRHSADEEDVIVSVFVALCRGAQAGRFQDIRGRDDLWWLLLSMTQRKAVSQLRRETALKRGGWRQDQSLAPMRSDNQTPFAYDSLISNEPSPEYLMIMQEEHDGLLALLRNDTLRQVANLRLEGCTNQEIADQLGVSTRAVERKLNLIRQTWSKAHDSWQQA